VGPVLVFFIWAGDGYWGVERRAAHAGLVMCEGKYPGTAYRVLSLIHVVFLHETHALVSL
jgi:hypothetical protein